jgi:hypothetical protein
MMRAEAALTKSLVSAHFRLCIVGGTSFCMGVNLVSYSEVGIQAEGVSEEGAEEDIWT